MQPGHFQRSPAERTVAGGPQSQKAMHANEEAKEFMQQQAEEQRRITLRTLLTPEAQERLHRVELVKAEKARAVEAILLQNAQRGRITDKVDEGTLIEILQQTSACEPGKSQPKVTIRRRRLEDEDDFS